MVIVATLVAAAAAYAWGVRRFDAAHPARPLERWRVAAFGASLLVVGFALVGPMDRAAHDRFSAHMVQHLLLTLVAPPLLLSARPVTLARRTASGRARRALHATLRGRVVRSLTHPVVGWLALPVAMWATHFTWIYDAAVGSPLVHLGEHGLYLGAGLLFWLPVVAAEPMPHRLGHAARVLYVAAALPANGLLALALHGSARVLYPSYSSAGALADQRSAAAIMWIGGALLLVASLVAVALGWARSERRPPSGYSRASPMRPATNATAPTARSQGP